MVKKTKEISPSTKNKRQQRKEKENGNTKKRDEDYPIKTYTHRKQGEDVEFQNQPPPYLSTHIITQTMPILRVTSCPPWSPHLTIGKDFCHYTHYCTPRLQKITLLKRNFLISRVTPYCHRNIFWLL